MATEYNKILLGLTKKPSHKYQMVSVPMYMYRVETNEFIHGLNFFQKTILKFKSKPGIRNEIIAKYLGIDPKLVVIVVHELQTKKLLNEYGSLSESGKEMIMDVNGLIIDSTKKKIGYVFKYVNQDRFYEYYINKIIQADIAADSNKTRPQIVTGLKGDGEDYTDIPYYLDEPLNNKITVAAPKEREILKLIRNVNHKGHKSIDDNEGDAIISGKLSIRLLNEQPEVVWICTYIYLQRKEDDTYAPEFRILDPFGYGDNVSLKYYIINPANKNLLEKIEKKFANTKTVGGKIIAEYQDQLNKLIVEKMLIDFYYAMNNLDDNLQQYIKVVVKNYILQNQSSFLDIDASVSFSLNIQNILENILKQDKEKRNNHYQSVYNNLDSDPYRKKNALIGIYRHRVLSIDTYVPKALINASKGILSQGKSLISYLVAAILTYNYDNKSPIFKILKNRIEIFIEVAYLRNEKGHGQTENEKILKPLSKEEVEKYYSFIKSLINDYILEQ